ncbi:MAG: PAS domain S-box protein [Desulfosporosinus sp.]|nr:PAS domain S-box protein [Desulfosporosinus sp.]
MRDKDKSKEQFENNFSHVKNSLQGIKSSGEVTTAIFKDKDGLHDNTKRKQIEDELSKTNTLLKLFIQKINRKAYLDAVLILLQEWIGCRCSGIRVLNEDGYIPYESFIGYSQEFMESENWLFVKNNQCACIRVILEKPEPQDAICMANGGSFFCNNTIKFVCEMSAKEQSRFRGKCLEVGFKSIAIIPIRYRDRVLGVIHLADENEGKFPLEFAKFIEKVAPLIGEAMYRFNLEDELRHKNDNLERLVEERTNELKLANEQLNHDIIEQKFASEKLIKSQNEMTSILESMTDCFFAIDKDFQFTYVNSAGEIAFGKSRDELLSKRITEVYKVNNTALLHYHEVLREKKSANFEILSEALGNKWLEMSVYPTETGMTCYFRDITSRKKAEKDLRESENKFSKAFHGGPIMMTLSTVEEGEFLDVNDALCSGTGYTREEFIGHTSKELNFFVDMPKRQKLGRELMVQGRIDNAEIDFRTKSGEIRQGLCWSQLFYLDGRHCHITGLIDVTEQKRIRKEMARLDRLNLVGQLAAGIAHEVRNPMTTVRGYLQLLGEKSEYVDQKPTFDLMVSEIDRANSIITEFLSLVQTKQSNLGSHNLNDIINNLYPILEADTFTQNKQINFIAGEIPNLELNRKEIFQLILNLTRNGLDAMEEGGSLSIESYVEECKVVLEIADEGCGIPKENLNKLGTPFFTTKDTGTGLGLASCYKITESHNAKIRIGSSPKGTTISILFPIPDNEQGQNKMIT